MNQTPDNDYPLIPSDDITPEARLIAVRWVENYQPCGFDIEGKQKLASDIMNYARRHSDKLEAELTELHQQVAELRSLKQSIVESKLKAYFPAKEMSFHDKVVLAIDKSVLAHKTDEEIMAVAKSIPHGLDANETIIHDAAFLNGARLVRDDVKYK